MVSRIFKSAAAVAATLSLASAASAGCGAGMYCNQAYDTQAYAGQSYGGQAYGAQAYDAQAYGMTSSAGYSTTMSSYQADSTYGTGSISDTYSDANTYSFSGSTASVPGLGQNESLQAVNCPVNVYGSGEGTVLGCYNVVKPVPQTTYYRVVRPVVYVRYPVPVAVPYTSPCHTITHYSRYGDYHMGGGQRSCR